MENFLIQVARLGIYINNSRMDITDKSLDYSSTRLKLKNQSELISQQKKGDSDSKSADDLLAFRNNMVDQQIGNRKIDDSVKSSLVTLSFYESNFVTKETIGNDDLAAYSSPFLKRLGTSIGNGWSAFADLLIVLANFWVIIPIGFGVWMSIKYYKKKKQISLIKS